jgi:hypothetical protein
MTFHAIPALDVSLLFVGVQFRSGTDVHASSCPSYRRSSRSSKESSDFFANTIIWQGTLQYQDSVDLKGSVASVERSDEQQPAQNPNPVHTKTVLKFDESSRLVSRILEYSLGISTTTNVWENGRIKNQDVRHHRNDGRFADWDEWQKWSYDKNGHLLEFRAGKDKEELNDFVNFKYDARGRPLGYELYAQTLTEISYLRNQITRSEFRKYQHRKCFEQVQIVDDEGRVADLRAPEGPLRQKYALGSEALQLCDEGFILIVGLSDQVVTDDVEGHSRSIAFSPSMAVDYIPISKVPTQLRRACLARTSD